MTAAPRSSPTRAIVTICRTITAAEVYERALVDFLGAIHGQPAMGATARQAADTVAIVEAAVPGIAPRAESHEPLARGSSTPTCTCGAPATRPGPLCGASPTPSNGCGRRWMRRACRAAVQVTPSPEGWDNSYGIEAAARHRDRLCVFGRLDPASADPGGRLRRGWPSPARPASGSPSSGVRPPWTAGCWRWSRSGTPASGWRRRSPCSRPTTWSSSSGCSSAIRACVWWSITSGWVCIRDVSDPLGGLRTLPEFAAFENVRVKISGLPEVSREGFPFRDVHEHLAETVRRFGADRLIWGSNHPVVLSCCTYGESLEYLRGLRLPRPAAVGVARRRVPAEAPGRYARWSTVALILRADLL